MNDEMKPPDNLEKGTPEHAIIYYAYEVARAIRQVRQAASSGEAGKVKSALAGLKYYLTHLRRVTRGITEEMKAIEGKEPTSTD